VLILAADTSGNAGSLALADSGEEGTLRVVVERCWDLAGGGRTARRLGAPNHSDRIVPEIEEMLKSSGVAYADLGGLACAIGPGSFTGLRVALAALKGVAVARGLPLAGVSTLAALAANVSFSSRRVVTLMDARKAEVYAAVFETESGVVRRCHPDSVVDPRPFLESLAAEGSPLLFLGDARPAYGELVESILGPFATWLDGSAAMPHAGNVARIAAPILRGPRTSETEPSHVVPTYLRRPEVEWKQGPQPRPKLP
jgi:tRNA threonylcarbamoyladenosine biosynthesis protein TsaB